MKDLLRGKLFLRGVDQLVWNCRATGVTHCKTKKRRTVGRLVIDRDFRREGKKYPQINALAAVFFGIKIKN